MNRKPKPAKPAKLRPNHLYRFKPSEQTCDEYPALARYGETVCTYRGPVGKTDDRICVQVGKHIAYVLPDELGQHLGYDKPATPAQLVVLRCIAKGGVWFGDLCKARGANRLSADKMATNVVLCRMLEHWPTRQRWAWSVWPTRKAAIVAGCKQPRRDAGNAISTRKLRRSLHWWGTRPLPSDYSQSGLIARAQAKHPSGRMQWRYSLTAKGKAALADAT